MAQVAATDPQATANRPVRAVRAVNCSITMPDRPLGRRLALVKQAGIEAVEFWWPFAEASPAPAEVEDFARQIERSGLKLIGLNLFAGDMASGDRGVLSWPGRQSELAASAEIAQALSARLGVGRFNVLYGNRLEGHSPAAQDAIAQTNLADLAARFASSGGLLMIEPVSAAPGYPIKTAVEAAAVVDRAMAPGGADNIGVLLDLYHLAANGDDVAAAIARFGATAAHVQVADLPGRGWPGSGKLPLAAWLGQLGRTGYGGYVALECLSADDDQTLLNKLRKWKEFE
ncbi:MAG: TIM barrel protein [Bifidobacteriaceae bacterium]|jgi:hydroxypyruvate isomerase|nr:TIM barrel protein [Bifidobacteriaceae bacterium]